MEEEGRRKKNPGRNRNRPFRLPNCSKQKDHGESRTGGKKKSCIVNFSDALAGNPDGTGRMISIGCGKTVRSGCLPPLRFRGPVAPACDNLSRTTRRGNARCTMEQYLCFYSALLLLLLLLMGAVGSYAFPQPCNLLAIMERRKEAQGGKQKRCGS